MGNELALVMSQIEHTKRIDKKQLIEAIEAALVSAAKRVFGMGHEIEVEFDEFNTEFKAYYLKEVVDPIVDPGTQLTLSEARTFDPKAQLGDVIKVRISADQFGRIAAQTAKQVIIQRVQDAERQSVFDQFKAKEGDLVTGTILRHEGRNVIISLTDAEALLMPKDQVPRERYSAGDRMKFLIIEVCKTIKGPSIIVSRAHPNLIRQLFELEVPEIYENIVKIESVAREPGARTKISVRAIGDKRIDAVGACVGVKGIRVQNVVDEIRGEKIDIVPWDEVPETYISNALAPAKISRIAFHAETQSAEVVVSNDQLSLAIGKRGQNARLAARLTGTKIDIKTDDQYAKEERARMDAHFVEVSGMTKVEDESTDPAVEAETQAVNVNGDVSEAVPVDPESAQSMSVENDPLLKNLPSLSSLPNEESSDASASPSDLKREPNSTDATDKGAQE
jgi:N utilization substance protein A